MTEQETERESDAARERQALLDLPPVPADRTRRYGPHPSQVIDYYLPRGPRHGRLTLIHGGYWREEFDRAHATPAAAALAAEGLAVALIEYRRVGGGGGWPGTFDDVCEALDAAWDGARHTVAGHSAGGHLALWAANRARLPRGSRWHTADAQVASAVAIAPVADLASAHELGLGEGAAAELLGEGKQFQARLPETDPMRLLPAEVPAVLVHGTADPVVPVELSRRYAAASGAQLREVPGAGHFAPVTPGTGAFAELLAVLRRTAAADGGG